MASTKEFGEEFVCTVQYQNFYHTRQPDAPINMTNYIAPYVTHMNKRQVLIFESDSMGPE